MDLQEKEKASNRSHISIRLHPNASDCFNEESARIAVSHSNLRKSTLLSMDNCPPGAFARTIKMSGGQSYVVRGSQQSPEAKDTIRASRQLSADDPVHRLSVLNQGQDYDCFEINGIHFENQLGDMVLQNQNFNLKEVEGSPSGEKPEVTVREEKVGDGCIRYIKYGSGGLADLEEGGEWLTAVQDKDGKWSWVPTKDLEKNANQAEDSEETQCEGATGSGSNKGSASEKGKGGGGGKEKGGGGGSDKKNLKARCISRMRRLFSRRRQKKDAQK